jgi:hypothetical protein
MTNLLDSFNPEKAKCSICKEYFDKNELSDFQSSPYFKYITGLFCRYCKSAVQTDLSEDMFNQSSHD